MVILFMVEARGASNDCIRHHGVSHIVDTTDETACVVVSVLGLWGGIVERVNGFGGIES